MLEAVMASQQVLTNNRTISIMLESQSPSWSTSQSMRMILADSLVFLLGLDASLALCLLGFIWLREKRFPRLPDFIAFPETFKGT